MRMEANTSRAARAALLLAIAVAAVALLASGCRRPLPAAEEDSLPDLGPADAAARIDAPGPSVTTQPDASATADAGIACPANAPTLDICDCGCCGPPQHRSCYYPALGESVSTIPNPPPPGNCNLAGCSAGVRYICCADPGTPAAPTASYCLWITRGAEIGYKVMKREGDTCTSIDVGALANRPTNISAPDALPVAGERNTPCDFGPKPTPAAGGLGSIGAGAAGGISIDVHAVLFFETATGVESERFDVDGLDRLCP